MTAPTPLLPQPAAGDLTVDLVSALVEIDSANRRIRNRLAKQLGFSVTELTALFLVGDIDSATPRVLSAEIGLTTGAVTAVLDRLERAGYIERLPHPTDRRSILITLSFRGEDVMSAVMDLYAGAIRATDATNMIDLTGMADHLSRVARSIDAADDIAVPKNLTAPAA